jgi:hypothetical protein
MWKEKVPLNINSKYGILSCNICPPVFGGYKNLLYIKFSVILRDLISRFDCTANFEIAIFGFFFPIVPNQFLGSFSKGFKM